MKNKFLSILLLTGILWSTSCEKLDTYLDNPNAISPNRVELTFLFNSVMINTGYFMFSASDQSAPFVRMMHMFGPNYDNATQPQSFNGIWNSAYAGLLPDINQVIATGTESGSTMFTGIAKICKAMILMTMVDMFGDVPYSEALKGSENTNPTADPGSEVYNAALALLDDGIADLSSPKGNVPTGDIFFASASSASAKSAAWIRAANSLKLRALLQTRLVQNNEAAIKAVLAQPLITEASQDFQFNFGSNRANPDSRHPWYIDGYEANGMGYYLANFYMWNFFGNKVVEDPRIRYYFYRQDCDETNEDAFTLGCVTAPYPAHWPAGLPYCTASFSFGDPNSLYGGYWGRDHGDESGIPPDQLKRTAFGIYPAGGKFDADNCSGVGAQGVDGLKGEGIQPIILSSFVNFMRAEAALTMNTGEDAKALLKEGIEKSINKTVSFAQGTEPEAFRPSTENISAYVNAVLSTYDAADASDKLNTVITEYYLALWGNGLDAYNTYRRTGMPKNLQPTLSTNPGPFIRSFWYPANHVNLNANVSQKPNIDVKVFWDTNTGALQ